MSAQISVSAALALMFALGALFPLNVAAAVWLLSRVFEVANA